MRSAGLLVMKLMLGLVVLPGLASAEGPMSVLNEHHRLLLVFAKAATDPAYSKQRQILKNEATEMAERDLILIPVLSTLSAVDADVSQVHSAGVVFISAREQKQLRSRYAIQPRDFAVILLGKDGGEKLRSRTPVTMERLRTLIDSMPMRQQEMQERNGSASRP